MSELNEPRAEDGEEKEILGRAIPIILKKLKEYQWPELKHPGDDGGATETGYWAARNDFEDFLKSLE